MAEASLHQQRLQLRQAETSIAKTGPMHGLRCDGGRKPVRAGVSSGPFVEGKGCLCDRSTSVAGPE